MNFNLNEAVIAKMTLKKIMSQIDHIETLLAYGENGVDLKMTLGDWFAEMRVHLRRVEYMTEQAAR
jgi:hypothetical protein